MSFDLIIKNGTVILENEARVVDIAVKGGKIAAIGQDLGDAKEVMDASGLVVSPGMVDAHTHISEPGRSHWEGYETGTRAAAKGGITTMIEMPLNQLPATVDRASIELKFDAAKGKLTIDAAQLGGLVSYNIDRLHELDEVGVVGFKCFVATCGDRGIDNDFRDVNDWQFFKGAQKLGELGQPVLVHCENALICDALGEEAKREGRVTAHDYVASRPVFTEVEAIRRVLYLAKVAGCRLHVCHISSPEGVEEVTRARQEGQDVTCESCPHYFVLDTDQFEEIGTLAKCSPPIRDLENQKGMWEKLFNGEIDCLVSDHSPCPPEMKAGNIMEAWGGIAGLQNCMDVMFDEAVQKRGMSLPMFGKLMATNAADIFGLQQKGRIAPGKDADFVFIQPNSSYVLTNDDLEYRHKVSPYVGRTIGARITKTILRGDVIYDIEQGFLLRRKVNLSLNISSNLAPAMPVLAAGILRLRCVYVQFCSEPRKPVIRISVVFLYFCNTVVVPPTLLSAFQLPQSSLLTLTQYAFLATALACFAQAFCGHRRAIMEGPGGLWWGTILTITLGEASRGTPINDIATSLAVGIALSGVLTVLIGFSGLGHRLARLFTPSVMVLFMLMLGAQLTTIFFKGMLGLPFGIADPNFKIQLPPFALSVAVMCLVLGMIIFLPQRFARYGLLVGTITGWLLWYFCFPSSHSLSGELHWQWFPLGSGGALSPGIILTAVITGLVNISNTYGAIRGTDVFIRSRARGIRVIVVALWRPDL